MKKRRPFKTQLSFLESLERLHHKSEEAPKISIGTIFDILAGKGYAALFIILSLPFCLPIQIPGFSTPFGLLLCFLALRFIFAKKLWWPQWVLGKEVSSKKVSLMTQKTIGAVKFLKKISRDRLNFVTQNPIFRRVHGLIIFVLSLLLLLPLPIPFTNMLAALPILCIGVGLLEDDGVFILIGYFLAILCLASFVGLFFLGKSVFNFLGSVG